MKGSPEVPEVGVQGERVAEGPTNGVKSKRAPETGVTSLTQEPGSSF